ncbi:ADP-ribosylglycohydrolase family protein [Lutimonas saemankumensis]|uniref:ADP-ribosylglycohydrolase family protein n=1 Tax=Lutimonas saemankumensis TaxID=483016 RepID=UPI001CD2ECC5|nr:ADP-ribosylglycohydrolase family protein [Lutimonas saemankumensis]MCA0932940.1 ADP-ribosylglycohydrolase family protein [Lutimonas saemankumensis]
MKQILTLLIVMGFLLLHSCNLDQKKNSNQKDEVLPGADQMSESKYHPKPGDIILSREDYKNQLYGFWLGQCIANWTGLITEMDKIGSIGELKTGDFYTREDWGQPDQPSIWGEGVPSALSPTIDFILIGQDSVWGADDDTDIEYIYQHLIYTNKAPILSPEQIREGWLKHIKAEEENFLWVSNQTAFDLMREGVLPPKTSSPEKNENYMMIDAQLTTEIFGLFAPARPDVALKMSELPIRVTAREDAAWISEFYVIMYSLASAVNTEDHIKDQIHWMAEEARKRLPENSYSAKMFDFVKAKYQEGATWEEARDAVYQRYQVEGKDGYDLTSKNLYCNGCFAAGINFAASIVSLLYGEGDLVETIKIGALCGWDSDNPTATWGGLLGFMIGKEGVEKAFGQKFSNKFNIHRTRQNFPDNGLDTFENMSEKGAAIADVVVIELMQGGIDLDKNVWYIPITPDEPIIKPANN